MDEIKVITVRNHTPPPFSFQGSKAYISNPESISCWLGGCIISVYSKEQSHAIGQNTFKLSFMELYLQLV